jgi:hypothetical protein
VELKSGQQPRSTGFYISYFCLINVNVFFYFLHFSGIDGEVNITEL